MDYDVSSSISLYTPHQLPNSFDGFDDVVGCDVLSRPAIYDLDIGGDPDDTCVAVMVANDRERFRPALLITNDETPSRSRARFLAHVVASASVAIPIASGLPSIRKRAHCIVDQAGLVPIAHRLKIDLDGVSALERTIELHGEVLYFGLGALTNLAALLARRPEFASRIELIQMGPALLGADSRPQAQYNARIDPASFQRVLASVARPTLLASHTSWPKYPNGRQAFGLYPDDPLAGALRESKDPDKQLCAAHLDAWVASGKNCSIMHDPLAVLGRIESGLVDYVDAEIEIDACGSAALTTSSIDEIRAVSSSRTACISGALHANELEHAVTCKARLSLLANGDVARSAISSALVGDDLGSSWRQHNEAHA